MPDKTEEISRIGLVHSCDRDVLNDSRLAFTPQASAIRKACGLA